jgi:hypothetical protein
MAPNTRLRNVYFKLALALVMLFTLLAVEHRADAGDPYCEYYCYQYYIGNCPPGYMAVCQQYYQDCLSRC